MVEQMSNPLEKLKRERNALILAHSFQRPEVQDAADFVGGSLEMALLAARSDAAVIVVCGVYFMAETVAILCSPRLPSAFYPVEKAAYEMPRGERKKQAAPAQKTVLIPDPAAGCRMARLLSPQKVRHLRSRHPGAVVVAHINTAADIKAESDICCTTSNALAVVGSIPRDKEVIFIPDKYLGDYVAKRLKRPLILAKSYCPIHLRILPEHIERARGEHPGAPVIVQPDCEPDVVAMADAVLTHAQMFDYCRESKAEEFIIGTENGMLYRLSREVPGKRFHPASPVSDCPTMKLHTLEKIIWSLEDMEHRVTVEPAIAEKARRAIERMLEITRVK